MRAPARLNRFTAWLELLIFANTVDNFYHKHDISKYSLKQMTCNFTSFQQYFRHIRTTGGADDERLCTMEPYSRLRNLIFFRLNSAEHEIFPVHNLTFINGKNSILG